MFMLAILAALLGVMAAAEMYTTRRDRARLDEGIAPVPAHEYPHEKSVYADYGLVRSTRH